MNKSGDEARIYYIIYYILFNIYIRASLVDWYRKLSGMGIKVEDNLIYFLLFAYYQIISSQDPYTA